MKLYEVEIDKYFDPIARSIVKANSKSEVITKVIDFNHLGIDPLADDDTIRITVKEIE